MKTLFINEIRVDFNDISQPVKTQKYTSVIESTFSNYDFYLKGSVLIITPNEETIELLLSKILETSIEELTRITFVVHNEEESFAQATKNFKLIEAAGGIVEKEEELLLIKRFGLWDFPKGKIEKGEGKKLAAVREVEEETGAEVKLKDFITETFHTYPAHNKKGKYILKKTYWYTMECLDDTNFVPQTEEGIEEVVWMTKRKTMSALEGSYNSLQYLYNQYYYSL